MQYKKLKNNKTEQCATHKNNMETVNSPKKKTESREEKKIEEPKIIKIDNINYYKQKI